MLCGWDVTGWVYPSDVGVMRSEAPWPGPQFFGLQSFTGLGLRVEVYLEVHGSFEVAPTYNYPHETSSRGGCSFWISDVFLVLVMYHNRPPC